MVKDLHNDNFDDDLEKYVEDSSISMVVGGMFPQRDSIIQEYYNIEHGNMNTYGYQNGNTHIQTSEQVKTMTVDEQDMHIIFIVMMQYSLKQCLRIFGKGQRNISQNN